VVDAASADTVVADAASPTDLPEAAVDAPVAQDNPPAPDVAMPAECDTGSLVYATTDLVMSWDVDEGNLFLGIAAAMNRIERVPATGGASTRLATLVHQPREMHRDGADLFFVDEFALHSVPASGGAVTDLVMGLTQANSFTLTPTDLYLGSGLGNHRYDRSNFAAAPTMVCYSNGSGDKTIYMTVTPSAMLFGREFAGVQRLGQLHRCPLPGGRVLATATNLTTSIRGIGAAGADAYVATGATIERLAAGALPLTPVVSGRPTIEHMIVHASKLFWFETEQPGAESWTLRSANLDGSSVARVAVLPHFAALGLRANATHVFALVGRPIGPMKICAFPR